MICHGVTKGEHGTKTKSCSKDGFTETKKIAAGLVSDCFPEVSGMVIVMTYFRKD